MDEIRLHYEVVETTWLKWLGMFLGGGIPPVHCKVYWSLGGQGWMTELTSDTPGPNTRIVGKGDGYTIQITRVATIEGDLVDGDASKVQAVAESYASTTKGDLTALPYDREWYCTPQNYGGPMYDRNTSNTYARWLLSKTCSKVPQTPIGAIGWNNSPLFPGPRQDRL